MSELISAYVTFMSDGKLRSGVFAPDVRFDMNIPGARFQTEGIADLVGMRAQAGDAWTVRLGKVVATEEGFAAETDYDAVEDGRERYYRAINLVTVRDGLISEIIHYCTGAWDEHRPG